MVLRRFDSVTALNEDILIQYFQKGLKSSIWAQLDAQNQEQNFWDKAIEKAINIEAKTLLQASSGTQKINAIYFQKYRLTKKKDIDSKKNKAADSLHTNMSSEKHTKKSSTHRSQFSKKNQDYPEDFWHLDRQKQGCTYAFFAISVNSIKRKRNDISYVSVSTTKKGSLL